MSIKLDQDTQVGEIGVNAVDPLQGRKGIGTEMYGFAVAQMRKAAMRVATVATGTAVLAAVVPPVMADETVLAAELTADPATEAALATADHAPPTPAASATA